MRLSWVRGGARTTTRFKQRRWMGRVSRLRPVLLTLGVVALVTGVGWVVLFSSLLSVDTVRVQGQHSLSARTVIEAAGVKENTPLARVSLDEIQQRIEGLPAVDHATVHRSWPHTVTITVTERDPVAALRRHGGWVGLDAAGIVFPAGFHAKPKGLPVVEIRRSSAGSAYEEVAAVVAGLPGNVVSDLKRLKAGSMDSIELVLRDGRLVRWGSADQSTRKVEVLQALLRRPAQVYDVSVPEQPSTSRAAN